MLTETLIKRQDIYDLYWYFAYERQNIFVKKKKNLQQPWTKDPILQTYKFCNSYRVNDRVSQFLLRNVIYPKKQYSKNDTIFRIILFKIFNKESTWNLLESHFKDITISTFAKEEYSKILQSAINSGTPIYNDAYISCANKAYGYDKKHDNHLALLHQMFIVDHLDMKIINSKSMEEAFNLLKSYPLIGNFLAYQLITDINYSDATNFSEDEFTVAGPGSIRGINKCFSSIGKLSYSDIIKYMYNNQEKEFKRLGYDFKYLGNRKLQLIDIQNIFCELDKYCRVYKPELKSNRTRIKKTYKEKKDKIEYMYPPKWHINN